MNSHFKSSLLIFALSLLVLSSRALAVPSGLTFQGRLVNNGVAVESASVVVTLKVTSTGASECTLFEETQTLNMTNSDGVMAVTLGQGSRTGNDQGLTIAQVFSNKPTTLTGLTCTMGGTTYTPSNADSRNLYVTFNDGGAVVAFSSPFSIQSVPYALEADSLSGKSLTDFIQVSSNTTQTKVDNVFAPSSYTALTSLIAGTSSAYAPASGTFSSSFDLNNQKIIGLAAPTASTDAANKNYVDTTLGTKSLDSTTLAALNNTTDSGKVLTWNGTTFTASAPAGDSTKLPLAGGTMTGAIAMGSNNITAAGYITQSPGKYVQFGNLDDTAESTLVSSPLTSAYAGATWFNTTSGQLKYWDGSSVKSMSTSFPVQSANQIFAGPASGGSAAPGFRALSEADIPTLTAASKVSNSATSAASANTNSAIVARDGSGSFAATNVTLSKVVLNDTQGTPKSASLQAPTTITNSYVLKMPTDLPGTSGFVLSSDTSGNLSWISPSAGLQSSALTSAHIWVGNGSNVATDVAVTGDVAVTNAGATTVNAVKGKSVSGAPTTTGQVLRYDGTNWTPNFVSMADLRSTVTGASSATSCTAGQTLTYTSVSDNLTCTNISIGDSQITYASESANKFLASPSGSSGAPSFRTLSAADLPVTGTGGAIVNGGNTFGAASSIGNTDSYNFSILTANSPRMTVTSSGNVGIGTTAPRANLDVSGTFVGQAATSVAAGTVDFSNGNIQYTTNSCGAFQLNNLKDGGNYAFIVQGTTSATCSFTAYSDAGSTALTVHLPPDHGATIASKHTIYNIMVAGTHVYFAWTPGY